MSSHVRRVLIADGNDLTRRGIKALLEQRSTLQIVAEASDGRMALAQARSTKPNIAIVDYVLTELNGVELTCALKRELPDVEVVIFTRDDREDMVLNALRAGVRGYVRKSDPDQLFLAAIDAVALRRPYFSGVSEEVLEQVLDRTHSDKQTLTFREREIVQLIAEGHSNKVAAGRLAVSTKTVETHRAAAMRKLNLRNTAQLVRYALRNKFIEA